LFAAFAADAVLFHADASARMSFRSDAFTFFDVGKTFATSGSKTTTFVPSAQRRAYFPRRPCEKSYSSRIPFRSDLLDFLFIKSVLSTAFASGADDADIIAPVSVNDNEQIAAKCSADRDVTAFCYRVIGKEL
jgi:hypothetical protein